jgi:hypothetical protein
MNAARNASVERGGGRVRPEADTSFGVHVRVDHVGDGDVGLLRFLDEPLLVAGDHIDRHGLALAAAAEEIRQRGFLGCQLFEEHCSDLR